MCIRDRSTGGEYSRIDAASSPRQEPGGAPLYRPGPPSYSTVMRPAFTILVAALVCVPACSRAREYELRGQVLAVDAARQEITIKHEDIKGFMPGMTMPVSYTHLTLPT